MLPLIYRHLGGNFPSKVFVQLGISKLNSCFYSINDIALDLGEELCQFWDRWFDFENKNLLTKVSSELSQRPTNITVEQTTHLGKVFIVCLLSPYDWHIRFKCLANAGF